MDEQTRNQVPAHVTVTFWAYLSTVCLAGFSVLAVSVLATREDLAGVLSMAAFWTVLVLIVLGEVRTMVTASMTDVVGIVTSAAFVFAALLAFGLTVAALLHLLAGVTAGLIHRRAWWRTCFNAAQYTLSLTGAWLVLSALGWSWEAGTLYSPVGPDVLVVVLAAAAYATTNHLLVWSAVSLTSRQPLRAVIGKDLRYQLVVDASLFSIGTVTAVLLASSPYLVLLLIVPLLAVSHVGAASADHERLALTDPLTGLANRTSLRAAADAALEAARRQGEPLALLALDLDRFKQINDTLGHHVGDHVLRITAARLSAAVRDGDLVARLGGDEFAVLLSAVDAPDGSGEVLDRLRQALTEPVVVDGHVLRVGSSVGAAHFPVDGDDLDTLLRAADRAMYADKLTGLAVPVAAGLRG